QGVSLGVADGTRTRDTQDHNLVLYQLNYSHHCCSKAARLTLAHSLEITKTSVQDGGRGMIWGFCCCGDLWGSVGGSICCRPVAWRAGVEFRGIFWLLAPLSGVLGAEVEL